jgi:hypothetical protein
MSRRIVATITDRQSRHGWCVHFSSLIVLFAILILPARAQIDTNSNGLSDVWERLFNNGELFDPQNPDHASGADPDGDGWSNLKESIAGTDPFFGNPPEGMVATQITYLKDQEEAPTPEFPEGRIIDLTVISWETLPGKQYTLLFSPDLTASSWLAASAPIIGDGQPAAVAVTLTDAEGEEPDKLFWRVAIDDLDSDGDGLTDYEEFILGTSPFHQDSDGDEIPDYWEVVHNLDPLDLTDADQPFQGGPSTNIQAYQVGVQAHPNASLEDFDGDGVPNDADAAPWDSLIDWELSGVDRFMVIEMQAQILNSAGQTDPRVIGLDSEGNVLLATRNVSTNLQGGGFWKVAANTFDPAAEVSMSYNDPVWGYITRSSLGLRGLAGDGLVYYANAPVDYNFGGALVAVPGEAAYGFWPAFRAIEGEAYDVWPLGGDIRGTTYCYVDNLGANGSYGFPSALYLLNRPSGSQPTVTQAATFSDFENASQHSLLTVTRQGWVAFFDKILHPSDAVTLVSPGTSNESGWLQDLPERSMATASVALRAAPPATGILVPDNNSAWQSPKTFAGQPIIAAMPNGTFINSQHELWTRDRRENHTDSAEVNWLPPREWAGDTFVDLIEDGWIPRYVPGASDTSGSFAIHLEKPGETSKVLLFVPFSLDVFPPEPTTAQLAAAGDDTWEVETFQIPADEPEFWIQTNVFVAGWDEDGEPTMLPAGDGSVVTWEIVSDESAAGASLSSATTETEDGHTAVLLTTTSDPGDRFKIRGKLTTLILPDGSPGAGSSHTNPAGFGEVATQLFEVVPGNVVSITLSAAASTLPADGASEAIIEAVLTDSAGNPAARGTDVNWRVSGGGVIKSREHLVAGQDGIARATLVAGTRPGTQTVTVEADGVVAQIPVTITPVEVSAFTSAETSIDLAVGQSTTLTLQTSGVADGAEVTWRASKGTLIQQSPAIQGNSAQAVLSADSGTTGTASVFATVGDAVVRRDVNITSSAAISVEVAQPLIVHGESSDGSEDVPTLSGSPQSVPYFAGTPVTIRSPGNPNAWATMTFHGAIGVGGVRFPFDEEDQDLSPSTLPGLAAGLLDDADIEETWNLTRSGTGSLSLPDTTASAAIPHNPALSLGHGTSLTFSIRPSESEGSVFGKSGEFGAEFLPDGRLAFTVGTGQAAVSVATVAPLVPERWHDVDVSVQSGHVILKCGGATSSAAVGTLPTSTTNSLVIGGFVGHFDELRFSHRQPGLHGIAIHSDDLDSQNSIQLDGNGEATITVAAQTVGAGPPPELLGQNIDIEVEVAGQSVTADEAITVTDKGTAVLIRAIAGQTAVIGTDTHNLNRAEMARQFLKRGVNDADRAGALPDDMGGDAAARGECGYLIAIWMEETVDDAGIVHPLMHITAQNLPEEIAEVLNWMLAEMMVSAGQRGDSESFADYILRNHRQLLLALQSLSAGDEEAFLAIAEVSDGEEAFADLSATGNQVGNGLMTRVAKSVTSGLNNHYELLRAAFNRRNSRIKLASLSEGAANFHHAIRGPILAAMQAGEAGIEAVLRDLSQALHTAEIIDDKTVAAVGALYGFLREGNEITQEIAHPELFAKAIPTLLDLLIGAARGDQKSLEALQDIGVGIVMGPVNEIPQAADAWDDGEFFNAGSHYAAAVVGGALVANEFKRSLQRGAYRCVGHGKHLKRLAGIRGEALAKARFRAKGYTDIVAIQNNSGHGIDLIMRSREGKIVAVEVKSHLLMQKPVVRSNMRQFVESRLAAAASPNPSNYWKSVSPSTRAHAIQYYKEINVLKKPVRGIVVNVDYVLTQYPREKYFEWSRGLGAEIFQNQF